MYNTMLIGIDLPNRTPYACFILLQDVDPMTVKSSLSADGVLTILAPKMAIEGPTERSIPIEMAPAQSPQRAPEEKK